LKCGMPYPERINEFLPSDRDPITRALLPA
jgi:hypothetical protein